MKKTKKKIFSLTGAPDMGGMLFLKNLGSFISILHWKYNALRRPKCGSTSKPNF